MNIWEIIGMTLSVALVIGMCIYLVNYIKARKAIAEYNESVIFVLQQRRMPQRAEDLFLFWLMLGGVGLIFLFAFSWNLFK